MAFKSKQISFQFIFFIQFLVSIQSQSRLYSMDPKAISELNLNLLQKDNNALAFCISSDETTVYIAGGQGGLFIVDITNMLQTYVVFQIPSMFAISCQVRGVFLFLADLYDGFFIYNIRNSLKPQKVAQMDFIKSFQSVEVTWDGLYAFLLANGQVFSIDVSNQSNPKIVSSFTQVLSQNSYRLRFDVNEEYLLVSNHMMGVQILDIRDRTNIQLRLNQNPSFITWDCIMTYDRQALYVADGFFGLFYAEVQGLFTIPKSSNQQVTFTFKNLMPAPSLLQSLIMTRDNSYIVLGFRSQGLKLYQILNGNYQQLQFVQQIEGNMFSNQAYFTKNQEQYLYLVNGYSFLIYQSVIQNLNQDFPNLFNTYQSALRPLVSSASPTYNYCFPNQKYYIETNYAYGNSIISQSDPYNLLQVGFIPFIGGLIDGSQANSQLTYLFVAMSQIGLAIYNIKQISNPQLIVIYNPKVYINPDLPPLQNLIIKQKSNSIIIYYFYIFIYYQSLDVSPDQKLIVIANGFSGIVVADISNPEIPIDGGYYSKPHSCGFEKCKWMKDSIRIVCTCRETGIFFFYYSYSNKSFALSNILISIGTERFSFSSDQSKIYLANGFQGVVVIDITNFDKPIILGKTVVTGWVVSLDVIYSDKYLVIAENEKGQIAIINVEDPKNPYVQQKMQFPNEHAQAICVTADEKYSYFSGTLGTRTLPLTTNLKIHSQIQVIQTNQNGQSQYQSINPGQKLLVGQQAVITFVPLYTELKIKIQNVYYYRNFELNALPSWIIFLESLSQLTMNVDKSATQNNFSNEKNGENILILDVLTQNQQSDFNLNSKYPTLAQAVYNTLLYEQYIDAQGFLTSKLDPMINFELKFYDDNKLQKNNFSQDELTQIQYQIKKKLIFSKISYPIRFFVQSSLQFNYNNSQGNIIQTPSPQVSIFFQILQNGIFVKKAFEGVLASFSDDQTSLKIQGQTSFVNQIVSKSLQISTNSTDFSQILFFIDLSDSANFDILQNLTLSQLSFISLVSPIEVNNQNDLQTQFNKIYSQSKVYVEERFSISFDMDTFKQKDGNKLTYKAYWVTSETNLQPIITGDWIEFNDFSLVNLQIKLIIVLTKFIFNQSFSGQRSASYWFSKARIRVVATDGYTSASNDFVIYFASLPFLYVFQFLIQILGPIIGVLGIYKYRFYIHLCLFERYLMHNPEVAVVGKMFQKQIILIDEITHDLLDIWNNFLKQNKLFKQQLISEYKSTKKFNFKQVISQLQQLYTINQKKYKNIDPREFDFSDSRTVRIVKKLIIDILLNEDKNTKKLYSKLVKYAKKKQGRNDWYKFYTEIIPKMEIKNNNLVLKRYKLKINEQKKDNLQSQKYITQTKIIVSDNNIHEKVSNFKPCSIADIQKQFLRVEDAYSIHKQQSPQISNEKIIANNQDDQSKQIYASYNKSKENNIENIDYIIDQSKDVIEEDEDDDDSYDDEEQKGYNNLNPFPEIFIKQENLLKAITSTQFNKSYDLFLIIEYIILEASGIITCSKNIFNPSKGESLHVFSHELNSLQAYRKDENQYCICLMNVFNMGYSPIGLTKNNPLPKWLNHQIRDGIIHIWGVPKINDDPEIRIRVISQNQITIRSFHIVIQDEKGNDLRDKNYLKKAHVMMREAKEKRRTMNKINSTFNIQLKTNQITSQSIIKDYQLNVQNQKSLDKQDKIQFKQSQMKPTYIQNNNKSQSNQKFECSMELVDHINSKIDINQKNTLEDSIQDSQINKDIEEKQADIESQLKIYQNLFRKSEPLMKNV
ncbi:hypothetical protein ABPG74_003359 [Tetrahymena malaccensis]